MVNKDNHFHLCNATSKNEFKITLNNVQLINKMHILTSYTKCYVTLTPVHFHVIFASILLSTMRILTQR